MDLDTETSEKANTSNQMNTKPERFISLHKVNKIKIRADLFRPELFSVSAVLVE